MAFQQAFVSFYRPSHSLFVGDLDASVTDDKLEDFFSSRYHSVKGAKIMWEDGGISRGYGFVRFGDEDEMRRAKYEMQGSKGLGLKAIRCSIANPKGKNNETSTPATTTETTTTADPYSQPWSQQYDSSSYQYYQQYYNYYGYYPVSRTLHRHS